ncbi:MAG: peptidoglycan DD-metalloendopeptidase family protein [Gammaproteobacteria bacterium]
MSIGPAYWLLLSLVTIFTILVLLGINSRPAGATRHIPLELADQAPPDAAIRIPASLSTAGENPHSDIGIPSAPPAAGISADVANADATVTEQNDGEWHTVKIKSGDSLAKIFSKLDISPQQLHKVLTSDSAAHNLKKIYPGQTIRLLTSPEAGLLQLDYQIDELNALEVRRQGDDFDIVTSHRIPERRVVNAISTIDSSLFIAAQDAGLSNNMTMELADIFGWDIDFALDIRSGDQFAVLYEELYLDGEKIGDGNILAAVFVNQGNTFQAVRYTDQSGRIDYYSLDGKSMRKAFLRTPVEFSRISSRFSLGRKHPILNRIRAHKGVDYAAATGTPVKATGDGKIIFRGRKGGYGNAIIIQHGTKYSTLYGHLSKFRSGLKTGSRVKQGQIIGYVGMTGLATGPHLHYEFRIDGVHRDPLRVKLPGADPLPEKYRKDFEEKSATLLARLDTIRSVQVARSD